MSALRSLETNLEDVFVKKAPALPANGKKAIVEYLPWISLILGVLSLWVAYGLWQWAHLAAGASKLIDYTNSFNAAYGGPVVSTSRMSTVIWLGLALMAVQGLLYVAAFPGLRDRKKSGWNLVFYALLVNIAYGVAVLFSDYGDIGNLIGTIIGSAIGFYFLFQIRASYSAAKAASTQPKV